MFKTPDETTDESYMKILLLISMLLLSPLSFALEELCGGDKNYCVIKGTSYALGRGITCHQARENALAVHDSHGKRSCGYRGNYGGPSPVDEAGECDDECPIGNYPGRTAIWVKCLPFTTEPMKTLDIEDRSGRRGRGGRVGQSVLMWGLTRKPR